jgi:hypothetical protein
VCCVLAVGVTHVPSQRRIRACAVRRAGNTDGHLTETSFFFAGTSTIRFSRAVGVRNFCMQKHICMWLDRTSSLIVSHSEAGGSGQGAPHPPSIQGLQSCWPSHGIVLPQGHVLACRAWWPLECYHVASQGITLEIP